MSLWLVAFICFAAVSLASGALSLAIHDVVRHKDHRLSRRLGLDRADEDSIDSLRRPLPAANRIDRAFERLLEESGTPLSAATALALVAGLAIIGCAAPLFLTDSLLGAAGGLILLASLPLLWWNVRRWWRLRKMSKHLAETLELLADGVRSGRNLEQATEMVATEAPAPLNGEFRHAATQFRLGHTPVAVLERMVRRVPFIEFKIFATAVLVHRQTGGNLALLIERLAEAARQRQEFRGHLQAVTSGSRLSALGLVVGSLIALGFLSWMRPDYLDLFRSHPFGLPMLVVAAALQLIGVVWVWRILQVEY